VQLHVGDRVEARHCGGNIWFKGEITAIHGPEDEGESKDSVETDPSQCLYDVLYEDGDKEKAVPRGMVRPLPKRALRPIESVTWEQKKRIRLQRMLERRAKAVATDSGNTLDEKDSQQASEDTILAPPKTKYQRQLEARKKAAKQKRAREAEFEEGIAAQKKRSKTRKMRNRKQLKQASADLKQSRKEKLMAVRIAMRLETQGFGLGTQADDAPVDTSVQLTLNQRVEGLFAGRGIWFKAIVTAVNRGDPESLNPADHTFDLLYDDGDEEKGIPRDRVRPFVAPVSPSAAMARAETSRSTDSLSRPTTAMLMGIEPDEEPEKVDPYYASTDEEDAGEGRENGPLSSVVEEEEHSREGHQGESAGAEVTQDTGLQNDIDLGQSQAAGGASKGVKTTESDVARPSGMTETTSLDPKLSAFRSTNCSQEAARDPLSPKHSPKKIKIAPTSPTNSGKSGVSTSSLENRPKKVSSASSSPMNGGKGSKVVVPPDLVAKCTEDVPKNVVERQKKVVLAGWVGTRHLAPPSGYVEVHGGWRLASDDEEGEYEAKGEGAVAVSAKDNNARSGDGNAHGNGAGNEEKDFPPVEAQLAAIGKMRDRGALTEQEYFRAKRKIKLGAVVVERQPQKKGPFYWGEGTTGEVNGGWCEGEAKPEPLYRAFRFRPAPGTEPSSKSHMKIAQEGVRDIPRIARVSESDPRASALRGMLEGWARCGSPYCRMIFSVRNGHRAAVGVVGRTTSGRAAISPRVLRDGIKKLWKDLKAVQEQKAKSVERDMGDDAVAATLRIKDIKAEIAEHKRRLISPELWCPFCEWREGVDEMEDL
jgi:hypothetical protein